jgi:hypothetical protein
VSDDQHEHDEQPEGIQIGSFLIPAPAGMVEAIRDRRDRMQMREQDMALAIENFFDDMTTDQLVTIREIINRSGNGADTFYTGWVTSILHTRGVCTGCGRDHMEDMLGDDHMPIQPPAVQVSDGPTQMEIPFPSEDPPPSSPYTETDRIHDMLKYSMREPEEGEVASGPNERPVICIPCGSLYQSLEDRMLRPPGVEGCEGCLNKQKWG